MANVQISPRELFRGDLCGQGAPVRPPWAVLEDAFLARRDRCGDCAPVCPVQAVKVETPEPSAIAVAGQGNPKS